MYIVGTAGHIDHGKTSLIRALTGIDCDRLPEEKEREMTIDIGFASIEYPRFGTVSIIDVPGHERFIRNMVVGAWGVDLGLLVVAADDGWMPQTEDHFRVLQLLGIERIIVVINKIDLADDETVSYVEMEIQEKLGDTRFNDSAIVKVSSVTGAGIDSLREVIVENLRRLEKITNAGKPYLFVDRIFAAKGHGTVITGTLKNGNFKEEETVHILPAKKEGRIKKIESHFHELSEGAPSQRTALNLAGVGLEDLQRGSIIYRENFFTESRDIIARIKLLDRNKTIKNNLGIEILIGTASCKGKAILIDVNKQDTADTIIRLKLDEPWFFYTGQPFIVTSPGGFRILGGGTVLIPAYDNKSMKEKVKTNLNVIQKGDLSEFLEFIIKVNEYISQEKIFSLFTAKKISIEKILNSLVEQQIITSRDDYYLTADFYQTASADILAAIKTKIGLNMQEIAHLTGIEMGMCKILMPEIISHNAILEKDGRYFTGDAVTEETLSDHKKKILQDIHKNGSAGIELDKLNNEQHKNEISELIKLGFLITLDGNIVYHKEIYDDLKNRIMELFTSVDKISISEVRDSVELSRKYIIPLLNRIERDGLIRRLGDFRIKV